MKNLFNLPLDDNVVFTEERRGDTLSLTGTTRSDWLTGAVNERVQVVIQFALYNDSFGWRLSPRVTWYRQDIAMTRAVLVRGWYDHRVVGLASSGEAVGIAEGLIDQLVDAPDWMRLIAQGEATTFTEALRRLERSDRSAQA